METLKNDQEIKTGIYNGSKKLEPVKGWKELLDGEKNDSLKPLSERNIQAYLMDIFTRHKRKKDYKDFVFGKYCPHQNTIVQLSANPDKCGCQICYGEIIQKGLQELNINKLT